MPTSSLDSLLSISRELSVLFIEDEESVYTEMLEVLQDLFSRVTLAKDGQEGCEKYLSLYREYGSYPDIIITDITMPRLSGVEMSRKMLELHPEQSIVVLSASENTNDVLEMLNMGVEAYVLKPIERETFLQTLQRVSKKIMYRKMAEKYTKELEHLAYVDPLTGISNRRRFFKRANSLLIRENPYVPPFTLCLFDIDKFKEINDSYGHDMGDAVLCDFVDVIKNVLHNEECFARFGGDEFIVIFQRNSNELEKVLEKIHAETSKSHTLLQQNIRFEVTMGMTQITAKDTLIDAAIKRADIHLYEKKHAKEHSTIEYLI